MRIENTCVAKCPTDEEIKSERVFPSKLRGVIFYTSSSLIHSDYKFPHFNFLTSLSNGYSMFTEWDANYYSLSMIGNEQRERK